MDVQLTPELEKLVTDEVASGLYGSVSEVIREGLRLPVEERRWREDVRRKVAEGVAEARASKLVDGKAVIAELRRKSEERRSQRK
jgi:antitoxin ParD1/3/4